MSDASSPFGPSDQLAASAQSCPDVVFVLMQLGLRPGYGSETLAEACSRLNLSQPVVASLLALACGKAPCLAAGGVPALPPEEAGQALATLRLFLDNLARSLPPWVKILQQHLLRLQHSSSSECWKIISAFFSDFSNRLSALSADLVGWLQASGNSAAVSPSQSLLPLAGELCDEVADISGIMLRHTREDYDPYIFVALLGQLHGLGVCLSCLAGSVGLLLSLNPHQGQ